MPPKRKILIDYTNRDFNSIKNELVEYAKRYYASSNKDYNDASFGSLTLDTVSYIGDILSFYTDYAANESFLDTAIEYENVLKHGKPMGYKFRANPSSYGLATFYIIVPAKSNGLGPNTDFMPNLLKGSEFGSTNGNGYMLNENVDFSNSNNEIVVASVDDSTGFPVSYAVKAKGQIISGELVEEMISVSQFERFLRLQLSADNITEVISVLDAEGHEYFEVEYLSQNIIYKSVLNRTSDNNVVSEIMKPVTVPRRFIVEQERDNTFLQFGYGTVDEIKTNSIADPTDVLLRVHGRTHVTDESFDPSKLLTTDKFGVVPSNTQLSVVYRKNSSDAVNAAQETITEIKDPMFEFDDIVNLNAVQVSSVIESLEVSNENPVVGDVSIPSSQELKRRIFDTFPTQNRAVTDIDYINTIYRMPPQFGAVKRAKVVQDRDSFKRNLNIYVIAEDESGVLTTATANLKKNIKVWLRKDKMVNDTIDILDAKIVNVEIEFIAVAEEGENKYAVLSSATERLKDLYAIHLDIGEPFSITDVYGTLRDAEGVLDVISVKINSKTGGNYSDTTFNFDEAKSPDGRMILMPDNVIAEVKYPLIDIKGSIR